MTETVFKMRQTVPVDLFEQVEQIFTAWQEVVAENYAQKNLVTNSQWDTWASFEKATNSKLEDALEAIAADPKILTRGSSQLEFIFALRSQILNADHKSEEELKEVIAAAEEAERAAEVKSFVSRAKSWLAARK